MAASIRFTATLAESNLIHTIAVRAAAIAAEAGLDYSAQHAAMDVTAVHCNGCRLNLEQFSKGATPHFTHDILGIRRYLDRKTGKLADNFHPRYAEPEEK